MDNHYNMAVVSVGYTEVCLPLKEACELVTLFSQAKKYNRQWASQEDGGTRIYIGGALSDITLKILPDDEYAEGCINGENKNG